MTKMFKQANENNELTVTCKKCQVEFKTSHDEKDIQFCSEKCQSTSIISGDIRIVSNCKICDAEFKHYGGKITCSVECLSKYKRQQKLNENNPQWSNKTENIYHSLDYYRDNINGIVGDGNRIYDYLLCLNKKLKNKIKERDGNCCQLCGEVNNLKIHHIDYDMENNNENNLITICKKCRNIVNHNRQFWILVFIGLNSNSKIVKKGWGLEIHFINNDKYCLKYLVFFKGRKFSWHKHQLKQELWFCMWGNFECVINTENSEFLNYFEFKAGDKIEIKSGIEHQLMALTDSIIVEVSTTDFPEDSIIIKKGN